MQGLILRPRDLRFAIRRSRVNRARLEKRSRLWAAIVRRPKQLLERAGLARWVYGGAA